MADEYLINFKVEGAPAVQAAAQSVSGSLGEVGQAAETSGGGLGNITSGLAGFAVKAGLAAAAAKLVHIGLGEIAEDEGAAQAMRKAGLSAEQAAKAMAALEDIELFTGDKVAAARLYGDVLNGKTRELKGYGITLAETATIEEKMAVIEQLRRRGLDVDAARVGTLTGEWQRFKHGFENAVGGVAQGAADMLGLSGAIGWVNTNLLGLSAEAPKAEGNVKKIAVAVKAAAQEMSNFAAKTEDSLRLVKAFKAGLGEDGDTDARIKEAQLTQAVAEGRMTQNEADKERANSAAADAAKKLQEAADDAETTIALVKKAREELEKQTDEKVRAEAESNARDKGLDLPKVKEAGDAAVAESQASKSKAAQALTEAENAAQRELRGRREKLKAAEAERDAKIAQIERQEGEERMREGKEAEGVAAKNNDEKVKAAEAERERKAKLREGFDKLAKELEKGGAAAEKAGADAHPRDRNGRKKTISPKSSNELDPLPKAPAREPLEIIVGKAEGAADKTKQSAEQAGKAMDQVGNAVASNTEAVKTFASTMQARVDALTRDLAGLQRRAAANA